MHDCRNLILLAVIAGTESKKKFKYNGEWTYTFPLQRSKFIHPFASSMAVILAIGLYLENYVRYLLGLYYGHIGNHILAFILCYEV